MRNARVRPSPLRRWLAAAGAAIVAPLTLLGMGFLASPAAHAGSSDGMTESAVTVSGRKGTYEDFSDLKITVSQTKNLVNQGITVSWSGGEPTGEEGGFGRNYLQMMQCWGEDPDAADFRETCVFGANSGINDGIKLGEYGLGDWTIGRGLIATFQASGGEGRRDPAETLPADENPKLVPFKSARLGDDNQHLRMSHQGVPPQREFFDNFTSNEVPFARTSGDGTGRVTFEVQTTTEEDDLGCGDPIRQSTGTVTGRPCWLVIVPRGEHDFDGAPLDGRYFGGRIVDGSPLLPTFFADRIVVPLEFEPVGNYCPEDTRQRLTMGSELMREATDKWFGSLCANGRDGFVHVLSSDTEAASALLRPAAGEPVGLTFVTDPVIGTEESSPPVVHAPVALSGAVIAMQIEGKVAKTAPEDAKNLLGKQIRDLKLTPRLVAKLLTQSYHVDVAGGVAANPDVKDNPRSLRADPEFLELNPQFNDLDVNFQPGGIIVPDGKSTLAKYVWQWVLADPEARSWLSGEPDQNNMTVNQEYRDLLAGSTGPDDFPKADATCVDPDGAGTDYGPDGDKNTADDPKDPTSGSATDICSGNISPWVPSLRQGALQTLRGEVKAQITWNYLKTTDTGAPSPGFDTAPPQNAGQRFRLSITDAATAARYGLATASLRNRQGEFVGPNPDSLVAASDAMEPTAVEGVLKTNPGKSVPGAYPLAMLSYAAVNISLPQADRTELARLLTHAATEGQTPGAARGQLPPGYEPLPQKLRDQTLAAARLVVKGVSSPVPTPSRSATGDSSSPATGQDPTPTASPSRSAASAPGPATGAGGGLPSSGPSSPVQVAQSTRGEPTGFVRTVLVAVLAAGLVSSIAGPLMLSLGYRRTRTG